LLLWICKGGQGKDLDEAADIKKTTALGYMN